MQDNFTHIFNLFLSMGTVLYIFAIVFLVVLRKSLMSFLSRYTLLFVCFITGIATVASLLYYHVSGFAPCDLCWYQRIFIYASFFISLLALIKKESIHVIKPYLVLLTIIGGIISLVHNVIYYVGYNPLPCSATASCTARYVFEFGFITIPLMALVTFVLTGVLLLITKKNK
jgi:disulfide bond formation protein DsbB